MRSAALTLLLVVALGCARIYRPVELAAARPQPQGQGLAGTLVPQPWGDNSRNEGKARSANLRVLVLGLDNPSNAAVEILRLGLPEGVTALSAEAAADVVKQYSLLHLLYPLIPALLAGGSSGAGNPASWGPTPAMVFEAMAVLGLLVGMPNLLVANNSNRRLGEFFQKHAWSPGHLEPGQSRRGLVFLRCQDPSTAFQVKVFYRAGDGEQVLDLTCPAPAPR